MMRTPAALMLAPLPAMLVSTVFLHHNRPQYGLLTAFVGLTIIAYAWEMIIILPSHLLLLRAKQESLIDYLLLGFLGLALPLLALFIYKSPAAAMPRVQVIVTSYYGVLGASTTCLFWLLRKPVSDRSSPSNSKALQTTRPQ